MRQKDAQHRLTQLQAPEVPRDLRARCLATIPQEARQNVSTPLVRNKTWTVHRFAFAATMVCFGLVASAFWTTQPSKDATSHPQGSTAFAQTLEAMKNVDYAHITARRLASKSTDGGSEADWQLANGWFDAEKGQFWTTGVEPKGTHRMIVNIQDSSEGTSPDITETKDVVRLTSKLQLPDGTAYVRSGSNLTVIKDSRDWHAIKNALPLALLGNTATSALDASPTQESTAPALQFTRTVRWKGQKAKLLQFGVPASAKRPGTRTMLYVDTDSKRVLGMEEFDIKPGVPDQLTVQMQADYRRPSAEMFDTTKIRAGVAKVTLRKISQLSPDVAAKLRKADLIKQGWVSIGKINGKPGLIDAKHFSFSRSADGTLLLSDKPGGIARPEADSGDNRPRTFRLWRQTRNVSARDGAHPPIPRIGRALKVMLIDANVSTTTEEINQNVWIAVGKNNGTVDNTRCSFAHTADGQLIVLPKPGVFATPEDENADNSRAENYIDVLFDLINGVMMLMSK